MAEGKKRKRFIKYIPAVEAGAAVMRALKSATPEQKARIRKVVLKTY